MVKEYLVELAIDAGKNQFGNKVNEQKLKSILSNYIESQRSYNEICALAEEIDFQGLVEYIKQDLLDSVNVRLFAPQKGDRQQARERIVSAAITYSKANTSQAKCRVAKCIYDCLDMIRGFYAFDISKKEYLLASEIVDAVGKDTQEMVKKLEETVVSRLDNLESNLTNGSLFSIERATQLAGTGDLATIESGIKKMLDHISLEHPLSPDFGFTYVDGNLRSKALTKDAEKRFPVRYVLTGPIRFGDTYYNDSEHNPLDYAYRHQRPIAMEISKAVKYLGDRYDPIQSEAKQLEGNVILGVPPQFPPAFPCSIKVGNAVFFDHILLRTEEILDDGTYVISNKEQNIYIHFEVRINPQIPNKPDFTISINHANNHEMLNYVKFMKSLSQEKDIHIYVLKAREDIIAGSIDGIEYKTGFASVDEEIDFLDRVCTIEDYFNVSLNPAGEISEDEYHSVIYISNLIKNDEVHTTWSEVTFAGSLDQQFRKELISMDSELYMISYVGVNEIELFGSSFKFKFMRCFKCAHIVDYEKVKKKAEILDDGDSIKISFKAGKDKSAFDTLNIPNRMAKNECLNQ